MQLTMNVYVETGFRGANVSFITTKDGILMIDSPYMPTDALKWRREIETKGQIRYIINTESHNDHIAGNYFFPVQVIAHDRTREDILRKDVNQILETFADIDPNCLPLTKEYRITKPSITFSERLTLHMGQHHIYVMHLPGHTFGQTGVFVPEERVVFTGDNVFGRVQSFLHDASPFSWLKSLKQIDTLDVDYVVPGHGEICDKSSIKEQANYIYECLEVIKNAISQGLTKEEALNKISLPRHYPIESGSEKTGERLLPLSVSHLYDLLSRSTQDV